MDDGSILTSSSKRNELESMLDNFLKENILCKQESTYSAAGLGADQTKNSFKRRHNYFEASESLNSAGQNSINSTLKNLLDSVKSSEKVSPARTQQISQKTI